MKNSGSGALGGPSRQIVTWSQVDHAGRNHRPFKSMSSSSPNADVTTFAANAPEPHRDDVENVITEHHKAPLIYAKLPQPHGLPKPSGLSWKVRAWRPRVRPNGCSEAGDTASKAS